SFCGGSGGGSRWSTVGAERRSNSLAKMADRNDPDGFSRQLLAGLPVIPAYWPRMRPLNRRGPAPLRQLGSPGYHGILTPAPLEPDAVRELLDREAIYLVDARDPAAFGGAHIPGSFSIGLGESFGIWAGSVVPHDRPIVLVLPVEAGSPDGLAQTWSSAVRQLLRAGYDRVSGYLAGGLRAWADSGHRFDRLEQLTAQEAQSHTQNGAWSLLDVRQPKEWAESHAPGALHVPGAALPARLDGIDRDRRWLVACSTGYRSSIAASLLRRAGLTDVGNVLGGMTAWTRAGLPVER
ncbi:MAG TPA: rhodanese-like domain-containing protein, partial [Chloroflexota bacterium]|nr:rhodanese-like domain-containing protein [Chloroflexota bacterium]